jgi:transcriptional regulator with XRE-family HTH domain
MRKTKPTPFPSDPLVSDAAVLGAAVRAARTGAGLRLADAAALLGVAKQTLADLETGKGTIGLGLALKIAENLGATVFVVPSTEREKMRRLLMESSR